MADETGGDNPEPPLDQDVLRFTPDPSLRHATVNRFVAALRTSDPQAAAGLERLQRQGGIFETMAAALAPFGLSTEDLGDAYAMWWMAAWGVFAGDTTDASPAQARAVAAQARSAMLATPWIADYSAAQKQQMADPLLLQGALLEGALQALKADPALKPQYSAAMAATGRQMGIDFSAMTLTESGFVWVGDPAGAAESTPPSALDDLAAQAAADAAAPTGDPGTALIDRVVFYMWGDLQFHPVVLLRDGTAYDVDGPSLEALPPERSRIVDPASWGRWHADGTQVTLINADGSRSEWTLGGGGLYQSFPAGAGQTLDATYKSVSGSQIGEMSMLLSGRMTFKPDGSFSTANDFTASGSGDLSGVSMAGGSSSRGGGSYIIAGHRIVLTHQDGRKEDLFFGYGSEGSPPRPDEDMIFIGRTAYVVDD